MKNKKVRNIIEAILLTAIAVVMLVSIGPANVFVHGNYCDVVEVSNIDKEDLLGEVDLHQNEYKGEFVPEKANFRGFQLWIVNIPEKAKGGLEVSVYDKNVLLVTHSGVINVINCIIDNSIYSNSYSYSAHLCAEIALKIEI